MVKKEQLHICRDKQTVFVMLFIPLMMLLLFGFAISTEVKDVRLVVVTENHTPVTRDISERLAQNEYFTLLGEATPDEVETLLKRGTIDAALFLRTYSNDGSDLKAQIMVDGSNPPVAESSVLYIEQLMRGTKVHIPVIVDIKYNPQLKSAYNFVPGIMGMIFLLICSIMTSVSIVGEKEKGTMNLLLVSPVKPYTVIFGKLVPYFALSCIILALMLVTVYTVLGLPFSASVINVIIISLIYIMLSLSIGMMVSTMVSNQVGALIVSAIWFMIPVILLSGMIFPIDNMPTVLQWMSGIVPARWYVEAMRKIMIQQLGLSHVWKEVTILCIFTVVILAIAIANFYYTTKARRKRSHSLTLKTDRK